MIKEADHPLVSISLEGIANNSLSILRNGSYDLDVVYNHVYDALNSNFQKVVPNYYFRRTNNGKMSNCSYCGNDLATEKRMVRKYRIC